jgi:hypothetical protein
MLDLMVRFDRLVWTSEIAARRVHVKPPGLRRGRNRGHRAKRRRSRCERDREIDPSKWNSIDVETGLSVLLRIPESLIPVLLGSARSEFFRATRIPGLPMLLSRFYGI